MMKLSARRTKFVEEYILDHNGTRAARAAGYSVTSAHVASSRLLRNDKVKAAIALKTHEMAQQYEMSKSRVITEVQAAIKVAENKFDAGAMIRGWVEIGKLLGYYAPEVIELAVNAESRALRTKYEAMSDEELMEIINDDISHNNHI